MRRQDQVRIGHITRHLQNQEYECVIITRHAHRLHELRTSAEVVDYEQDGASVTAILTDGGRVTGGALIGADGLWSNIRKRLVGDGAPRVSGHTTYRSVIPVEDMPEDLRWNAATLWAGPKCHIVHYPLSGWKLFNLVVTYHNDAPEPVAGQPVSLHRQVADGVQEAALGLLRLLRVGLLVLLLVFLLPLLGRGHRGRYGASCRY